MSQMLSLLEGFRDINAKNGDPLAGYNRMAQRDAVLDTSRNLSTIGETLARQEQMLARMEQAREQEARAAAQERERIAELPKCSDCQSPIDGSSPNTCPQCKELLLWFREKVFALPQVKAYLSTPLDWSVLREDWSELDPLLQLIESSIAKIASQDASLKTKVFEPEEDFTDHLHSFADRIDMVESEIAELRTSIELVEYSSPPVSSSTFDSIVIFVSTIAGFVIGFKAPIGGISPNFATVVSTIVFGILGLVVAMILTAAIRTVRKNKRQSEIDSMKAEFRAEMAPLKKKLKIMKETLPGECATLLSHISRVWDIKFANDKMRDMWLRMCKSSDCSKPNHMLASYSSEGPLEIRPYLAAC